MDDELLGVEYHADATEHEETPPPTTRQKVLRIIGDTLHIRPKKDQELRRREARAVAIKERREEEMAHKRQLAQEEQARIKEEQEKARQAEIQKKQIERELLEKEMGKGHANANRNRDSRIRNQRIQEAIERDLNHKLLSIDYLEEEVLMENPGVEKHSISYAGSEIPVYDLKGIPFSILSTTIDYRKGSFPSIRGVQTYRDLMENPALWNENLHDIKDSEGFGESRSYSRSDVISTSYRKSESILKTYVPGELVYGFERVDADSIISITAGDGGTKGNAGKLDPSMSGLETETVDSLLGNAASYESTNGYNEILLRRYSENGTPKKPDYIITEDGKISEAALRHAQFFGIPIINIDNQVYDEKMRKRGDAILDSISESDSYAEINQKMADLHTMSKYQGVGQSDYEIRNVGGGDNASTSSERAINIRNLELAKRLVFIKDTLKAIIKNSNDKSPFIPTGLDYFRVAFSDIRDGSRGRTTVRSADDYRTFTSQNQLPPTSRDCNTITIIFKLKGTPRVVKTVIHDGARRFKPDEIHLSLAEKQISESSTYDEFIPLVQKYLGLS